jgi:hypothetical protein
MQKPNEMTHVFFGKEKREKKKGEKIKVYHSPTKDLTTTCVAPLKRP